MGERLTFGDHVDQWVELSRPAANPRGLVGLVHGGYWRRRFTAALMVPLGERLLAAGWTVANLEYRRGAEASWPTPIDDVTAGWARARAAAGVTGASVLIGHSVGGQLALLCADADAVVGLAPVTDLERTHAERLGDDAVAEYFGSAVSSATLRSASPSTFAAPSVPTLLVHGTADDRVPIEHTLDYAQTAADAKAPVDAVTVAGADHRQLIDPEHRCWSVIDAWLATVEACGAPVMSVPATK